jgi:hypothetical protein
VEAIGPLRALQGRHVCSIVLAINAIAIDLHTR